MLQVHAAGGWLLVDSTFAPPPIQYPFKWGADIIMHSGVFLDFTRLASFMLRPVQAPSISVDTLTSFAVFSLRQPSRSGRR